MKILFLSRLLHRGGAERQLVTLACALKRRGHEPVVALFYATGPLLAELEQAGVRVVPLHKRGRWDMAGFVARWVRLARAERPDVLHPYLSGPNLLCVLLKPLLGAPVVWGLRMAQLDTTPYDWFQRILYGVQPLASRWADLIICNSHAGRAVAVASGYPAERTVVVPNGIDVARFRPDAAHRTRARAAWGMADDELVVGIVGRLDPVKDHPTFLHAAARLAACTEAVRFVCVGDDPQGRRPALQTLAGTLGLGERLLWLEGQGAMEAVYPAFDLLVSSSSGEGFPNVVAEAMACGVPCAVTDVGDSAWIVGETGAVAPPGDPDALCRAMLEVLGRRSPARSAQARARVVEHFSVDALAEKTLGLLASVRQRRAGHSRPDVVRVQKEG
jgi:glycosyltransferase involved in cell wall biosynthesis